MILLLENYMLQPSTPTIQEFIRNSLATILIHLNPLISKILENTTIVAKVPLKIKTRLA